DFRWLLLLQCLFGALMAWMVMSIASILGVSRRGCLLAGSLWAIHPPLICFDNSCMTESLFNILSIAGLFLLARKPTLGPWLGGGFLGLAGLLRPLAILYLPMALLLNHRSCSTRWFSAV